MADAEKPKIIVDDDWKSQARAEKERLAATEKPAGQAQGQPGAEQPAGGPGQGGQGPATFDDLIKMLASQALLYLGAIPDPESGKAILAPDAAKMNIDMLGILQEKTKGNLTDEEQKMLDSFVSELRMQFVEIQKAVAKAYEEGRISPTGEMRPPEGGGMGGPGGFPGGMPGGPNPGQ